MTTTARDVLLLSGPVGVGKTTVGIEASSQLTIAGVAHLAIDLDAFCFVFPRPADDPFGTRQGLEALRAALATTRAKSVTRMLMAYVVEAQSDADAIADVVGGQPTIIQLSADRESLLARVAKREIGASRGWARDRAVELAETLTNAPADLRIDTSGVAPDVVARQVLTTVGWL